jgi:hypothetical protein
VGSGPICKKNELAAGDSDVTEMNSVSRNSTDTCREE